jgi:hypothetical protein
MKKLLKKQMLYAGAAFVMGMMSMGSAKATGFSAVATNANASIENMPGLVSGVSYLFGLLIGVLGILKVKDHVENPNNTPLKDGAIRLLAGGGLLAAPSIYQAMVGSIGNDTAVTQASLNTVEGI